MAALTAASLALLAPGCLVHQVYLDRSAPPDFDAFVRFELPGIGEVYDTKGHVLIELAHEYRRQVSYEEIPPVVRQAILSAEDKRFFSHPGVDLLRRCSRVLAKTLGSFSLAAWWRKRDRGMKPVFPQGGSTLTQQLVRGDSSATGWPARTGTALYPDAGALRLLSLVAGVPATNKLLRKLEEARLAFWLEEEMHLPLRVEGAGASGDLRALRQLHLPRTRPLRVLSQLRVLLRQAARQLLARRCGQGGAPGRDCEIAGSLRASAR